jgi:hypothetical protein
MESSTNYGMVMGAPLEGRADGVGADAVCRWSSAEDFHTSASVHLDARYRPASLPEL